MTPVPLGIYVHWPYCSRVCPYCDFNVVRERGREREKAALVDAILADLRAHAPLIGPRPLRSIFLGGGTPSLMAPEHVCAIIETATALWPAAADIEITLEANPTDAETGRFAAFAAAGVNRLSLGLQSLNDEALRRLGRNHDSTSGRRAARAAAEIFPRMSIDLIYALPGQNPADWASELADAIALGCEHVSPYQLTIEPGTAFDRAVRRKTLKPPEEEVAADLYEVTQSVLRDHGFDAYEVSNHARGPSARSAHNLLYWRGQDYIGVGPGAHGRLTIASERWATLAPAAVADYIARAARPDGAAERERLSSRERATERLLMGLRTAEGVALSELAPLGVTRDRVGDLGAFAQLEGERLRITDKGRPVLDRIIAELAT